MEMVLLGSVRWIVGLHKFVIRIRQLRLTSKGIPPDSDSIFTGYGLWYLFQDDCLVIISGIVILTYQRVMISRITLFTFGPGRNPSVDLGHLVGIYRTSVSVLDSHKVFGFTCFSFSDNPRCVIILVDGKHWLPPFC